MDIQSQYQRVLWDLIKDAGGKLDDVVWTHQDKTTTRFGDLTLKAVEAIHRYMRIQHEATRSQLDTLAEQATLQKSQKQTKKKPGVIPDEFRPGSIAVGNFKATTKKLGFQVTSLGFTLFVLEEVIRHKEKQNLTISPMLARLRRNATGKLKPQEKC